MFGEVLLASRATTIERVARYLRFPRGPLQWIKKGITAEEDGLVLKDDIELQDDRKVSLFKRGSGGINCNRLTRRGRRFGLCFQESTDHRRDIQGSTKI